MTKQSTLQRIAPDELPALLTRLADEQTTALALIGPTVRLTAAPNDWPAALRGRVVFQLTSHLSSLPGELLGLDRLHDLALWSLDLKDAEAAAIAGHLGQLTTLALSDNEVGDAGARAIAEHLGQLTTLDLSYNQVGEAGARAIAEHLGQLTTLALSDNEVGDAGARAIAEHLGQLTTLALSDNQVGEAGARAIAEHLGQLTTLDLRGNKRVTTVPPLAQLSLARLNLAETGITDLSPLRSLILAGLPVHWEKYLAGPGIYVEGCPLTHPSPEVVQQGPAAVVNYFREIETQGVDQLFEAKLLIVGEGGAGKTSLLRRLFLPELELPAEDETTRGIAIHHHTFPLADGRSFRLNAWDFGGQQIYHATHQFFLTKRSLYVLVDDTRSNYRSIHDKGFKFWLEVVETLSEGSPVLIFQNEKGGRSKVIDEAGIKGRFPNVLDGIHRGNLEDPAAADGLRQAVEYFAQRLPHIGEDVPAKWVAIRREIEELAHERPHIALDEYFALYARHLDADQTKALHLSQYLHDLGVFLHFQQPRALRRTVFLQNQWVTDAVFRILDDEAVKARQGRFTLADCDRLWSDRGYAAKEVELLALMVRFELSYPLPDTNEETWLVPQHLSPSKPPALRDWATSGDLMLSYRYDFLPRGLVSRLIVRMHRFVKQTDLCWSDGALFEHGATQLLVETTERGDEIALRSRGPEQQALLSVIASDLDALNDSFQGLKARVGKWVPCTCPTCAGLKAPALFAQTELLERKERGKLTIECPKPPDYHDVSVLQLLDGMNLDEWLARAGKALVPDDEELTAVGETARAVDAGAVAVKTIRIFLASSAELRADRDAFDLYFRQQNDRLRNEGLYLQIERWENFLDAMAETRLQDEYNRAIRDCDLFVSLFQTKTGQYTAEEFGVAWQQFQSTGKPLIYTYFRKAMISTSDVNLDDLVSLRDFQAKLDALGHFYTAYDSIDGLQRHFRDQLDRLRAAGRL